MSMARGSLWSTIGQGLQGLGRLSGQLSEREQERLRREADLARIEEERAFQRERLGMQDSLRFIEAGGGMGPAPTTRSTVPGTRAPVDLGPTALIPRTVKGPGLSSAGLIPEPGALTSPDGVVAEYADPRFAEVGDGYGYVMRPDVMEAQQRNARVDRIAQGFEGLGDEATRPRAFAGLAVEGVNPPSELLGGDPLAAKREEAEFAAQFWRDNGIMLPGYHYAQPGGGGDGTTNVVRPPSYPQAVSTLQELFTVEDPETMEPRLVMPQDELDALAQKMASGQPYQLPRVGPNGQLVYPSEPGSVPNADLLMGSLARSGGQGAAPPQPSGREQFFSGIGKVGKFLGDGIGKGVSEASRFLGGALADVDAERPPISDRPAYRPGGMREPPRSGGAPALADTQGPSDAEVRQAIGMAVGMAPEQVKMLLLRAGATQDQIDRLLPNRR